MIVASNRIFIVRGAGSHSGAGDLMHIGVPANTIIVPLWVQITADSAEGTDQLTFLFGGRATAGSGGSSVTPVPTNPAYGSSACTCRQNDTVDASGFDGIIAEHGAQLQGKGWYWDGWNEGWTKPGTATITLTLESTPGASLAMSWEIGWAEL